jgi:hypothetical protein
MLTTFLMTAPGDGHGPMHVQIGGMWGDCQTALADFVSKYEDILYANVTEEEILAANYTVKAFQNKWGVSAQRMQMFQEAIVGEYFHIYRSLWRSHLCAADNWYQLLECPDECDVDTVSFEECKCQVNALVDGSTTWQNLIGCLLSTESNEEYFVAFYTEDMLKDLIYLVANTQIKEGEMVESASTADILFWMIHPVLERLLAAKREPLATNFGGHTIEKWTSDKETWFASSIYDLQEGQNKYHPEAYTCKVCLF